MKVKISPTGLTFDTPGKEQLLRVSNDSGESLQGLMFSLYNKKKFKFEPAKFNLLPYQTKIIFVTCFDSQIHYFQSKEFAYLKRQESDFSLKLTIYIAPQKSKQNSRQLSRQRNLEDCQDKFSYKQINNFSYIERLKDSEEGSRMRLREETNKLKIFDQQISQQQIERKSGQSRMLDFNQKQPVFTGSQQISIRYELTVKQLKQTEYKLSECEKDLNKTLFLLQTQKQRNRLLTESLENRESQIAKLGDSNRRLNQQLARVHSLQKLFYQKSQDSLRQKQVHQQQVLDLKRNCQLKIQEFQLKTIELKDLIASKDRQLDQLQKNAELKIQKLKRHLNEVQESLDKAETRQRQLQKNVLQEKNRSQRQQNEIGRAQLQNSELRFKCDYYLNSLQKFEKELMDKKEQVVKLRVQSCTNPRILPQILEEIKKQNQSLTTLNRQLQEEVLNLRSNERSSRGRAKQLQMLLDQNQKHTRTLQDNRGNFSTKLQEYQTQNKVLIEKINQLQNELTRKSKLFLELDSQQQKLASQLNDRQNLEDQLKHAKSLLQSLQGQNVHLQVVNEQIRRQKEKLYQRVLQLQNKLQKQKQLIVENRLEESINVDAYKETLKAKLRQIQQFSKNKIEKLQKKRKKADQKAEHQLLEKYKAIAFEDRKKDHLLQIQQNQLKNMEISLCKNVKQNQTLKNQLETTLKRCEQLSLQRDQFSRQLRDYLSSRSEQAQKYLNQIETIKLQMKSQLESCSKALHFSKQRYEIMKNRLINQFKFALGQANKEISNKDLISLIQRRSDAVQNLSHKEAIIASIHAKKRALKVQLHKARQKIKQLEHQKKCNRYCSRQNCNSASKQFKPEAEATRLQCCVLSYECKNKQLNQRVLKLQQQLGCCQQALHERDQKMNSMEGMLRDNQQLMRKANKSYKQQFKKINREMENLQSQVINSQEQSLQSVDSKPKICRICKKKDADLQRMRSQIVNLRVRIKQLSKQVQIQKGENQRMRSQQEKATNQFSVSKSEYQRKVLMIKQLKTKNQEQNDKILKLQDQISRLAKQNRRKQGQIQALKITSRRNEDNKSDCKQLAHPSLQQEIHQLKSDNAKLSKQLKQQRQQISKLKKDFEATKDDTLKESARSGAELMMAKSQCNSLAMVIRRIYGDLQWKFKKAVPQLKLQNAVTANTQQIYQQFSKLVKTIAQ